MFGYADSYDDGEYANLLYKESMSAYTSMGGLLVNPEMADIVKEEQRAAAAPAPAASSTHRRYRSDRRSMMSR